MFYECMEVEIYHSILASVMFYVGFVLIFLHEVQIDICKDTIYQMTMYERESYNEALCIF